MTDPLHTLPPEIIHIITNNLNDVIDWLNFMLTSNYIYKMIYPVYIIKKFKFMILYHQKLPPCTINNKRIKHINNGSDPYPFYVTTDDYYINSHCLFSQILIYETYGLFFPVLQFDNFSPEINHQKLFDLISDNEQILYIDLLKKIYSDKPYVKHISPSESYRISNKFIKNIKNKEYYSENKYQLKKSFNNIIKRTIQGYVHPIDGLSINPKLCIFCEKEYGDNRAEHINLHTDGHKWYDPDQKN